MKKNYMEDIAKMINHPLYEEWESNNGNTYMLSYSGLFIFNKDKGAFVKCNADLLHDVLTGLIEL